MFVGSRGDKRSKASEATLPTSISKKAKEFCFEVGCVTFYLLCFFLDHFPNREKFWIKVCSARIMGCFCAHGRLPRWAHFCLIIRALHTLIQNFSRLGNMLQKAKHFFEFDNLPQNKTPLLFFLLLKNQADHKITTRLYFHLCVVQPVICFAFFVDLRCTTAKAWLDLQRNRERPFLSKMNIQSF